MTESNLGFVDIFAMEVTNQRDREVVLMTWPYINSKDFSTIAYLLKIQNRYNFSLDESLITAFIAKAALYCRDLFFFSGKDELFGWS